MSLISEKFPGRNAIEIYNCTNNITNIIAAQNIEGQRLKKNDIIDEDLRNDIEQFKLDLIKLSYKDPDIEDYKYNPHIRIPNSRVKVNTPIIKEKKWGVISSMEKLIELYEDIITNSDSKYLDDCKTPNKLINTELGFSILNDLKNTKFTQKVFCHCYLNYKSLVLKNNRLIGVTNWQYAGYYPPEFEQIIEKYSSLL